MKYNKRTINKTMLLSVVMVLFLFFLVAPVFAQVDVGLEFAEGTGLGTTDIRVIVANIIRAFLGLLGITAIGLILFAGFKWMTAGGNAEKVTDAKKMLLNAGIGLAIVLSAYGITALVFRSLGIGYTSGVGVSGPPSGWTPGWRGGALGGGIIDSHYPSRGAINIPRNAKIIVTFKEDMSVATICDDADASGVNGDSFDDKLADNGSSNFITIRRSNEQLGPFVQAGCVTQDQRTFVIKPDTLLGEASEDVEYTVELGGDIKKADGNDAFSSFGSYEWSFLVSTFSDTTPPTVRSIIPLSGSVNNPRNSVVQITFSESMDPLSVAGLVSSGTGFTNISTFPNGTTSLVNGSYLISNQYRTVEFITDDLCGTNACGGDVFCLPGNSDLSIVARAATLANPGSSAEALFPYDGAVDMAGNSLDGNADASAEGPSIDNYSISFNTSDEIDLIPPVILNTSPARNATSVSLTEPAEALFSKVMLSSTLNSVNIYFIDPQNIPSLAVNLLNIPAFWITSLNEGNPTNNTRVSIRHGVFDENTTYTPQITSDVLDIRQNCFNPSVGP